MTYKVGDLVIIHQIENKYLQKFVGKIVTIVEIVETTRPYVVEASEFFLNLNLKENEIRELTKLERALL